MFTSQEPGVNLRWLELPSALQVLAPTPVAHFPPNTSLTNHGTQALIKMKWQFKVSFCIL